MPLTDCCFLAGVCREYLLGLSQGVTPPRGQVPNRRLGGAAGQPAAKFAMGVSPLGRFKRGKMAKTRTGGRVLRGILRSISSDALREVTPPESEA